jgi:hypothetical protein
MPSLLLTPKVSAAQLTEKSVTLTNSLAGDDDNTATVSFRVASAGYTDVFVIQFCTTALIGTTCTAPNGLNIDSPTPFSTILINGGSGGEAEMTVYPSVNTLELFKRYAQQTIDLSVGDTVSFTLDLDNPNAVGTFYARILTYEENDYPAGGYSDTSPGAYKDYGSVALSTTNDITVTGIVTEVLTFCVGATDNSPAAGDADLQDCSQSGFSSGKTVGLGVIGSTPAVTPVATTNGGTNTNGAFLIKTNAVNGATVGYRANQNSSSGKLKIAGASCSGTSTNDGCINSAGTTAATITGESFGMAISEMIYPNSKTGDGTSNLVRDGEYDWTNSNTYAWDDTGTFDQIASSTGSATKVLDYELGVLKFSAISAPTTPSGLYSVSANFVATATF